MRQRDELLLAERVDAAEQAHQLAADYSAESLQADRLRRDAMLWNFTVLGEAATQVSEELKAAQPGIAWSQPIRLRNRIVHGYWSIDLDILLVTAQRDLPTYARQLRQVLRSLP